MPVNADFEGGFAIEPAAVAANVAAAAATGIAGLSIEDSTGDAAKPLFEFALAVERIQAARRAIDDSGTGILLTGRSEGFIVGRPDLGETIAGSPPTPRREPIASTRRASAPGRIAAVVKAVAPKPVNVLVGSDFTTVAELADLGVRRISVGGALARAAWTGFLQAAKEIAEQGTLPVSPARFRLEKSTRRSPRSKTHREQMPGDRSWRVVDRGGRLQACDSGIPTRSGAGQWHGDHRGRE